MPDTTIGLCAVFITLFSAGYAQYVDRTLITSSTRVIGDPYIGDGVGIASRRGVYSGVYPGSEIYPRESRIYPGGSRIYTGGSRIYPGQSRIYTGGSRIYTGRSGIYPGRMYDQGGLYQRPIHPGSSSLSSSTDICRVHGEVALHDYRGHVRTCRFRSYGDEPFGSAECRRALRVGYPAHSSANCRRSPGARYGMCCNPIGGIPAGPPPDYHCPDGAPNSGFCNTNTGYGPVEICPNTRHHECHIGTGAAPAYRDAHGRRYQGICCAARGRHVHKK